MDGGIFLDTGCHNKIMSIHEIKTGSYRRKQLRKRLIFGLGIGLLIPLSSNSSALLYIHPNNASVQVEYDG